MSMENYKGFIIFGGVSTDEEGRCFSYGLVCMRGPRTILQVQRIPGTTFRGKEEAEQHGIELCKLWIDEHRSGQGT
jgi:hypothetical protein